MHIFFDTTELVGGKTCLPNLGRISNRRLHESAKAIGASLYVADLAITEVIYRRWRRLREQLEIGRNIASEIGRYADIQAGQDPDEAATIAAFRQEIEDALQAISIITVPCSNVTLE